MRRMSKGALEVGGKWLVRNVTSGKTRKATARESLHGHKSHGDHGADGPSNCIHGNSCAGFLALSWLG